MNGTDLIETLVRPGEISRESLKHLIGLAEASGWRLVGWERLGKPGIDRFVATLEGSPEQLGGFVDGVFKMPGARPHIRDVFPRGVPRIDRVSVVLEALPEVG